MIKEHSKEAQVVLNSALHKHGCNWSTLQRCSFATWCHSSYIIIDFYAFRRFGEVVRDFKWIRMRFLFSSRLKWPQHNDLYINNIMQKIRSLWAKSARGRSKFLARLRALSNPINNRNSRGAYLFVYQWILPITLLGGTIFRIINIFQF